MPSQTICKTPTGKAAWIYVEEPRQNRFDETKSEWSLGLELPDAEVEPIFGVVEQVLTDKRKSDPKFPKSNSDLSLPFGPAKEPTDVKGEYKAKPGFMTFKFKRNAMRKLRGELRTNTPPRILDAMGRDIPKDSGISVGSGSMIKVFYTPFVYTKGRVGVALQLEGIQIIELKENKAEFEVEAVEGGWTFNADTPESPDLAPSSVFDVFNGVEPE